MITELHIASEWLSAPRTVWTHAATSGGAKDCLLFLDGELYRNRVNALDSIRQDQTAGELPAR
jgi:hypothetical protein